MKAQDIADHIKRHDIKEADLLVGNPDGAWNVTTVPIASFENRHASGAIAIEANRTVYPDLETSRIDHLRLPPTLALICDAGEIAKSPEAPSDPRRIAKRAEAWLRESGVADRAYFASAPTFYAIEHAGAELSDSTLALRSEAAAALREWDVDVELHRSGANAGQAEIVLRSQSLVKACDDILALKYAVKTLASKRGLRATFMPKPYFERPASGMPCCISLAKNGRALFYDASGYARCSQTMLWFAGGLLAHAASLLAFTAPSSNSYKRFAASDGPSAIAFSSRSNAAVVDVSGNVAGDAKAKHLEFRATDASANPYLAFSALLLAGLDGIKQKIDPVRAGFGPLEIDLATLPPQERTNLRALPAGLRESLAALAADNAYLTEGGVFTRAFLGEWIAFKTKNDLAAFESRPTPHEAELYFDC